MAAQQKIVIVYDGKSLDCAIATILVKLIPQLKGSSDVLYPRDDGNLFIGCSPRELKEKQQILPKASTYTQTAWQMVYGSSKEDMEKPADFVSLMANPALFPSVYKYWSTYSQDTKALAKLIHTSAADTAKQLELKALDDIALLSRVKIARNVAICRQEWNPKPIITPQMKLPEITQLELAAAQHRLRKVHLVRERLRAKNIGFDIAFIEVSLRHPASENKATQLDLDIPTSLNLKDCPKMSNTAVSPQVWCLMCSKSGTTARDVLKVLNLSNTVSINQEKKLDAFVCGNLPPKSRSKAWVRRGDERLDVTIYAPGELALVEQLIRQWTACSDSAEVTAEHILSLQPNLHLVMVYDNTSEMCYLLRNHKSCQTDAIGDLIWQSRGVRTKDRPRSVWIANKGITFSRIA